MSKFLGQKCVHCQAEFVAGDDIVVCPECGAPHHRTCFKELGHCGQLDLHGTQEQFYIKDKTRVAAMGIPCPKCGGTKPADESVCPNCGYNPKANEEQKSFMPDGYGNSANQANFFTYGMMHPDETIDGISAKELAIFVGSNSPYFLTKFKMMNSGDKRSQVNFAAFIFNFVYFFYRKMYKVGAIFLAVFILTSIPGFVITGEYTKQVLIDSINTGNIMGYDISTLRDDIDVKNLPQPDMEKVERWQNIQFYTGIIGMVSSILAAILANKLYYNHSVSKIRYIRGGYNDYNENKSYYYSLASKGRTNTVVAIALVMLYIASNFMVTYIQISSILNI